MPQYLTCDVFNHLGYHDKADDVVVLTVNLQLQAENHIFLNKHPFLPSVMGLVLGINFLVVQPNI